LKGFAQLRQIFGLELGDRKNCGFCSHPTLLVFKFDKSFFDSQFDCAVAKRAGSIRDRKIGRAPRNFLDARRPLM
jgi:hypothetical protein